VSDWAIAERVVVRKGEPIGGTFSNTLILVEEPTWSNGKGSFEMRTSEVRSASKSKEYANGILLDFFSPTFTSPDGKRQATGPPLLVDIEGGHKVNVRFRTGILDADDAAAELLILTPDGRLIARDSRTDQDGTIRDGTENGTTRQDRVQAWRKRNRETVGASPAGQQGGGGASILPGAGK
jgi:hypothetical protein